MIRVYVIPLSKDIINIRSMLMTQVNKLTTSMRISTRLMWFMITTALSREASHLKWLLGFGATRGNVLMYSSSLNTVVLPSRLVIHKGSPIWAILISSSMAATAISIISGLSASLGPLIDLRRSPPPYISPAMPCWPPKLPTPRSSGLREGTGEDRRG